MINVKPRVSTGDIARPTYSYILNTRDYKWAQTAYLWVPCQNPKPFCWTDERINHIKINISIGAVNVQS